MQCAYLGVPSVHEHVGGGDAVEHFRGGELDGDLSGQLAGGVDPLKGVEEARALQPAYVCT